MSNVDIHTIKNELNIQLKDAIVDKAYQPTKDTVMIKLRKPGEGRKDLLMQAGVRIHLTEYPLPNPTMPPNFPMLLRKYLRGGKIIEVNQHHFDRILEIKIEKKEVYTLIVELFSKGNIILLNNQDEIILPLKHKMWHDRKITSHELYKYPPAKGLDITNTSKDEIKEILQNSDRDITRTLATNGLGGVYAEEIISYTEINKEKPAQEITDQEITEVYDAINYLLEKIEKEPIPQIILEEIDNQEKDKDLIPINLNRYKGFKNKTYETFNKASDEFYSKKVINNIKSQEENAWAKKIGKYEKRLKMQEDTLTGFYKTIEDTQIKGDTIYAHYQEIQDIIDVIHKARETYSWKEVASIIKKAKKEKQIAGLEIIESIDKMGVMNLDLDGVHVQVDTNTGIPESCEKYYNKGKKAKRKIDGVNTAMENTKAIIKKLENKKEIAIKDLKTPEQRQKKQLKWYEKLRWFNSTDGYLIIGGRDASSNEQVVKKYSKSSDLYLHCDIHGAPSTIIQNNTDDEIPESTIYEAACFASSFSSAWTEGFSTYDAYWVTLDQVSKSPESGEFLKKGAFVIRGHKNFIRNVPVLIAIGVVEYDEDKRIMAGPVESVSNMTDNFVIIKPGFTKKERISKEILHKIDKDNLFGVDDIVRSLPSGKCDLLDIREYNQKYRKIR